MKKYILAFSNSKWKGYTYFFLSMLLYAFSGVVVVGLKSVLGATGQLIFRGLYAFVIVLIVVLIRNIVLKKPIKFSKKYGWGYIALDLICRPISTLLFVFSVILFLDDANKALFYLFSFRVIASFVIDTIMKQKQTQWNWFGMGLVLLGLAVFSFPWDIVIFGILSAAGCGVVEACQRKVWQKLEIQPTDRFQIGMLEFLSWFIIAGSVYLITINSTNVLISKYPMNLDMFSMVTFGYLTLATIIAVGTMWLDIAAFSEEDTLAGNVIQSSEMGFAGFINFMWNGTKMIGSQVIGAIIMILALVVIGMNKINKK